MKWLSHVSSYLTHGGLVTTYGDTGVIVSYDYPSSSGVTLTDTEELNMYQTAKTGK